MNFYDPVKNGGSSRQFSDSILLKSDLRLFTTPAEFTKVLKRIQEIFNECSKMRSQPQSFLSSLDKDFYYSLISDIYEYSKYAKDSEYDPRSEDAIISHLR